jgi:hypothetical protein
MKPKDLKKIIKNLIQEYGGGDASTNFSDDGNNMTSPRIGGSYRDDEEEMHAYLVKNKGAGGDGGHYTHEPATSGLNRDGSRSMWELQNFIKKIIEELDEDAYGHATLTTRGQKSLRGPGIWQEDEKELQEQSQNPRMADIDLEIERKTQAIADLNIEKLEVQLADMQSQAGKAIQQMTKPISDAEMRIAAMVGQEKDELRTKRNLQIEYEELQKKGSLGLTPAEVRRQDQLPDLIRQQNQKLKDIRKQKQDAIKSKEQLIKQKNTQASQMQMTATNMRKQINKQKAAPTKLSEGKKLLKQYEYLNFSGKRVRNLVEQLDSYKKEIISEATMKKFLKLFNKGLTDEEILRFFAKKGIVVPEQFVDKARKQYQKLKQEKLDLANLEQETKEFKKVDVLDNPTEEVKELTSRLFNENKIKEKYPIPQEIEYAITNTLKMNPIIRFVKNLKAVNSIPPSYRVFLLNNTFFDIYYEGDGLMAKINKNEYYLDHYQEKNYAIKHINRLMTEPILKTGDEEEGEGLPDFDDAPAPPPPPPPPPPVEPDEPEA